MTQMANRPVNLFGHARTYLSAETPRIINIWADDCSGVNRAAHVCAHPHDFRSSSSSDRTASRTEFCAGRLAHENSPPKW